MLEITCYHQKYAELCVKCLPFPAVAYSKVCLNSVSGTCCLHCTNVEKCKADLHFCLWVWHEMRATWEVAAETDKVYLLVGGTQLGETPSPSPLAESTPAAGSATKSPCLVKRRLANLATSHVVSPWSNDNFLFSITIPSSNSASHLIQLIQSISFLWD